MIRKFIILLVSFIISFPLFADPQILLNTDIDGELTMVRYYSQLIEDNNITTGENFIDMDGVHDTLAAVTNPFDITGGFTTDDFIVTFFGTVVSNQSHEVDVTNSSYYYTVGTNKTYISETPSIVNKSPSNGLLTFYAGQYYDATHLTLPTFTFQIESPVFTTIGAGRYFTDITISIVEI
jgi:hypothetical protein